MSSLSWARAMGNEAPLGNQELCQSVLCVSFLSVGDQERAGLRRRQPGLDRTAWGQLQPLGHSSPREQGSSSPVSVSSSELPWAWLTLDPTQVLEAQLSWAAVVSRRWPRPHVSQRLCCGQGQDRGLSCATPSACWLVWDPLVLCSWTTVFGGGQGLHASPCPACPGDPMGQNWTSRGVSKL